MMDYGTLAQLMQPQALPTGMNSQAAGLYSLDKERRDAVLQQATMMAQMQAQQEAMKADEYARGAPGRNANIDVGNAMAQGNLANLPTALDTQSTEAQTKNQDAKNKFIEETKQALSPYAHRWVNAKTLDEKKDILDEMEADKNIKFGGKNIRDIPLSRMDAIMADTDRTHPTAQIGKERIADIGAQGKRDVANINAAAKDRASQLAAQTMKTIADKKLQNQFPDPARMIYQQILTSPDVSSDPTVRARVAAEWFTEFSLSKDTARNQNLKQNLDIDPNNPEKPITARPPVVPKGPTVPPGTGGGKAVPSGGKPIDKAEALKIWEGMKGTPQEAEAKIYYRATYGEDPPK